MSDTELRKQLADAIRALGHSETECSQLRERNANLERDLRDADTEHLALANHNDSTCEAVQRRDRAETAIERVRALTDRWSRTPLDHGEHIMHAELHAALDPGPAAETTTGTPPSTSLENPGPKFKPEATEPAWTPPPPGDRREQLPDHLLTAIGSVLGNYFSTACHTATACQAAAYRHNDLADELRDQAVRLHDRCRLNQKFTGQRCVCGCHEPEAAR